MNTNGNPSIDPKDEKIRIKEKIEYIKNNQFDKLMLDFSNENGALLNALHSDKLLKRMMQLTLTQLN